MHDAKKLLLTIALFFVVIAGGMYAWSQRYTVYDWAQLVNYEPPAEIAAIADRTTMTDQGRRLFYVADPQIADRDTFNANCRVQEFTIILGCYIGGDKIYLYDIDDPRLDGIVEVTAAHEMLHVAYERLSPSEKTRVNGLLSQAFEGITNERILSNIEQYRSVDPDVVPNELHSILGTEVRSLSPELEGYYQQYFEDRQAVVALSSQYETEFTNRQRQVESLEAQLTQLKQAIDSGQAQLATRLSQIQSQQSELNRLEASGQFAQYNQLVSQYNQNVNIYNQLVTTTGSQIEQYNQLVKQYNDITLEVNELVDAIDSRPEKL